MCVPPSLLGSQRPQGVTSSTADLLFLPLFSLLLRHAASSPSAPAGTFLLPLCLCGHSLAYLPCQPERISVSGEHGLRSRADLDSAPDFSQLGFSFSLSLGLFCLFSCLKKNFTSLQTSCVCGAFMYVYVQVLLSDMTLEPSSNTIFP